MSELQCPDNTQIVSILRYLVQQTYASQNQANSRMEESMTPDLFHSHNHPERMIRKMEQYVEKRQLCDVTLIVGSKRIPAHRLVLSAASDYFAAMFMNDVKEASMEEIRMKDVDPDAMVAIVNYAYTEKVLSDGLGYMFVFLNDGCPNLLEEIIVRNTMTVQFTKKTRKTCNGICSNLTTHPVNFLSSPALIY